MSKGVVLFVIAVVVVGMGLACSPPAGTPCGDAYEMGRNLGPRSCVKIDGKNIVTSSYCPLTALLNAARSSGLSISLSSGFRTYSEQKYFWDCMNCGCCNGGNKAARPGHSNHQNGIAFDLGVGGLGHANYKWLLNNAAKYGFIRAVRDENWHWEYHPGKKCDHIVKTACYEKWCRGGRTFNYSATCKNADGSGGGGSTPSNNDGGALPGVGEPCHVRELTGICKSASSCETGNSVSGACAGNSDVKCCIAKGCTAPNGKRGMCKATSKCGGQTFGGLCPGNSDIKCCV